MNQNLKKEVISWVRPFVLAIGTALLIRLFIFNITPIDNISMEPTLYENDRVFLDIISYKLGSPKRSDVVVFYSPVEKDTLYVKRVIAVAGDSIKIQNGGVYINGTKLNEDYLPQGVITEGNMDITIPEDNIFVMGDNRSRSDDSRLFGPIPISSVKGHALFRIYPFNSIKKL